MNVVLDFFSYEINFVGFILALNLFFAGLWILE